MILHVISCNIYLCGRIENVGLLEHFCLEFSFVTDVKTAASTSFSNSLLALTVDVEPYFYSTVSRVELVDDDEHWCACRR